MNYPAHGFGAEWKDDDDVSRMQRTVAREVGRVLGAKVETMDARDKVIVVRMGRDHLTPEVAASLARAMQLVKANTGASAVIVLDHDTQLEALSPEQMREAGWVPATGREPPELLMATP